MSSSKRNVNQAILAPEGDTVVKRRRQQGAETAKPVESSNDAEINNEGKSLDKVEQETVYFLRIIYMYIDLGTEVLFKVFLHLSPNTDVVTFLKSRDSTEKLKQLRKRNILSDKEYRLVIRDPPKPDEFDISLLITLMINLLPNHVLPRPNSGWQKLPPERDLSLSADIVRLRKIRNNIVAHREKPRIPQWKFDRTWHQTTKIILRLTREITPGDEDENVMKDRIDTYKVHILDPTEMKRFKIIIDEWHEAFHERVEQLLKTLSEFDLYFSNESGRYERYIKLLIEGGHSVLLGVLKRGLIKRNIDVKRMLGQNTNLLQREIDPVYRKILFPTEKGEDHSDASKWDILLLATVLLTVFGEDLNPNEITEIRRIQKAMTNHAEAAITVLDSNRFLSLWTDLVSSIKCLSMTLDTDLKQKCDELIEVCSHPVDVEFSHLQRNYSQLKSITDVYKEQVKQLRESLKQMHELEMPFREPQTLGVKFITLGNSKQKVEMADKIVFTIWQEALNRAEDSTELKDVRREVDKILNEIRSIPNVTDIKVTHHCIILTIQCNSPIGVLKLIDYLENESFQQSVGSLAKELENNFDEAFIVKGNFTLDSLHDVKSKLVSDRGNRNEVNCPITVSSATGMKAVWSLLKSKEIEDSMKKMSKTLSKKLGEEITFRTSVNGFYHLFDETESDSSSSVSMSQSTALEDMSRQITKYTKDGSVSQHRNISGENNAGIFTDSWSTDSLCGYTHADDIEHFQYKAAENTQPDATAKVDILRFSILAKTEKDSDQIQTQRRTHFQEHVHDGHGKIETMITGEDDISYVHTQTQISIGDSIRPDDKSSYGTVGPFIRIKDTGELCFLTVRHIFGRLVKRDRNVVGAKVVHCLINHSKSFRKNNERICGEVIAAEYSEYLDAALVKISKGHIPNRYSFTTVPEEQCRKAGFSVPKYASIHSGIDLENANSEEIRKMQLIKFGSATGLTRGTFHFTDEKVKTENVTILCGDPKLWIMEAVPCLNYVHVGGIDKDNFAREEDNGAAVYLLDNDSQLHCVGMLCRQMSHQEGYLVGQLDVILERLGQQIGMTLEIDKYEKLDDTVDPYDKELFNHALQDGFECDRQIRVNIIGFFAQGKTTLTRRLLNEPFDDIACTDGIEVYVRKCKMLGNNWKTCNRRDIYEDCSRRLVDVVNLEQRNASDFNEEPSFDEADRVLDVTRKDVTGKVTASTNVSGSMGDTVVKRNTAFTTKDPEVELRRLFAMHLRDTERDTESDGLLANIWDFGGQFIYYATHQIFHSTDAIYLLVFDLTKDLDTMIIDCDFPDRQEKMKNSLMFWVNSIHASVGADDASESLRPKIILVGTHKDKFEGDVNAKFKDVFDLFSGTKLRNHIHDTPFAVASLEMDDEGVDGLKNSIYEIGVNNARHSHIPAKWIPLEISMLEMRDKKQILKFDDVVLMDAQNTHPITDKSQIKKFLNYHHEKGTIVFFNEDVLNKYVILSPQFLVNAFKCIITAKWFCRWNQNVQDNWKKLTREAVLEMNLLTEVWSQDSGNNFIQFKDVLLLFLERHRILAEIRCMDETTGDIKRLGKYMIPSMLQRDLDRKVVEDFLKDRQYTQVILGLELQGLESVTVFEKVTAALLGKWPPIEYHSQVLVFQNAGLYRLDLQHAGQIRKTDDNIELMVINVCPPDQADSVVCDRFRRYVQMVVSYEYRRNHLHKQEKPYKHYFKCNDPEHGGVGSHHYHYLDDIRNLLKVCCPDNGSRPIPVQNAIRLWFQGENITDMETNAIRTATENDDLIARVAQEYGENWKLFGIAIGLSYEELNPIGDQGNEVSVLILAMFKIWKEKYPNYFNYKNERERYGGSGVHVDWDKIRNCFDF